MQCYHEDHHFRSIQLEFQTTCIIMGFAHFIQSRPLRAQLSNLVFEQEVVILIEFLVPYRRPIAIQERWDKDLLPSRLENLERLNRYVVVSFPSSPCRKGKQTL